MPNRQLFPFSGELLPTDGSAIVIPGFIDADSADNLFHFLLSSLHWEEPHLQMFGTDTIEPRLSSWYAEKDMTYTYSGLTRIPRPWTPELLHTRELCETAAKQQFNGVLVNLYRNGADHLGWHADDETVNGPEPTIASLSLGAERRFDFRHRVTKEMVTTTLPHGSLLIMSGLSQKCWLHRVPKAPRLEIPRINLTFRHLINR